ncbi:glycosyltransferase family 2 protein [bacterium]|nr:glycosyltransferase family 2 protein [bacterium]
MKFSIIVINYNTKEITKNCLESIFLNCYADFEIILVDNSSSDDSVNYLRETFGDRIKIVENSNNFGFGKGNNIGSKYAMGEYLFFLNSDTIIKNNILKEVDEFIKKEDNILESNLGLLAPKLILGNGSEQRDVYGRFPNIYSTVFNKFFILNKRKNEKDEFIREVDWVSGAAFFIKNSLFKEVEGFDEKFFMYFEDIDLSRRIKNLGFSNLVNKNISLVHLGGKSLKRFNFRKKYYYSSQDYYFKKYYGIIIMIIIKILRFPFKLINNIYLILKNENKKR